MVRSLKLHRWLMSIAVLAGLLIVACAPSETSKTGPNGDTGKQAEGTPKRGGTVTLNYTSRWNADPAMGQTPYTTWYYTGDPMLRRDPDTFELKPGVFESWKVSQDGKEVILKVRPGMKFHNKPPINGREVEAKDLVYVLKSATGVQYPDLPSVRFPRNASLAAMKGVEAVDKYTVRVTLNEPSVSFLHVLTDYRGTWVYPDGLRESFNDIDALVTPNVERHIGSGPYILTKFAPDVEQIAERNPEYWDKGKPYVDRFRIVTIKDKSTELAAFVSGQIDTASLIASTDRDFVVSNMKDVTIVTFPPPSCFYRLALNVTKKPLDEYRVRRAMYLVMDKKEIGEQIIGSFRGEQLWKYPGVLPWSFPDSISQEDLTKHPLYRGPTPENVAEAKRLLKEAGYENGFAIEVITAKPGFGDEVQLIQRQIEGNLPGVKINIKLMDQEAHRALAASGDYEAQLYCHIHEGTAVATLATNFHTKGGRNYSRFSNPELDGILDKAEAELDPAKHKTLLVQAQNLLMDKGLSMLPTRHNYGIAAHQPYLRGVRYGAGTDVQMGIAEWWINK